jgi:hypothetical protein
MARRAPPPEVKAIARAVASGHTTPAITRLVGIRQRWMLAAEAQLEVPARSRLDLNRGKDGRVETLGQDVRPRRVLTALARQAIRAERARRRRSTPRQLR